MGMFDEFMPQSSASSIPAPVTGAPPGSNPLVYRDAVSKGSADNSNNSLEQAQGAIESAGPMTRLLNMANQSPSGVWGPLAGSNFAKGGNAFLGALLPAGGIPPWNRSTASGELDPANLASQQEKLTGAYNAAAIPLIKQLYGGLPRSPEQQDKALGVLGGTTVSDKSTGIGMITSQLQAGVDKINAAISDGRMTPAMVQRQLPPGYPFSFNPQTNQFEPNAPHGQQGAAAAPQAGGIQWQRGPNGVPQRVQQ